MKVAEGHNTYYMSELGDSGARAYVAAERWGVSFSLRGLGRTKNDYVSFAMKPQDGTELLAASRDLIALTPSSIETAVKEAKRYETRMAEQLGRPVRQFRGPGAPLVHEVVEVSQSNWNFIGGDIETRDDVVGSARWTEQPESLVTRIEGVDSLIFQPDAFRTFALIAGTKPDFPKRTSIWDRI